MTSAANNPQDVEVIPVIDNKPVTQGDLVGDALSVISLKNPSEDSDPDRVVKRNSYRDLHRPNISNLDWVSQSPSKEEVFMQRTLELKIIGTLLCPRP